MESILFIISGHFCLFRVIAVGDGEGDLLSVAIDVVDKCESRVGLPLASTTINLTVETSGEQTSHSWQGKKKVGLCCLIVFVVLEYLRCRCLKIT